MPGKDIKKQIQLIYQALNSSATSINLARQLLRELENSSHDRQGGDTRETPGIIGKFNGQSLINDKGEKFDVPSNYASKSQLVFGDTLKMMDQGASKVFKQIDHVARLKLTGIVAKKDGRWAVVTAEGSYKVLDAAVDHYRVKEGDEVYAIIPADNKHVPFAALEPIKVVSQPEQPAQVDSAGSSQVKPEVKLPEAPKEKEVEAPARKTVVKPEPLKKVEVHVRKESVTEHPKTKSEVPLASAGSAQARKAEIKPRLRTESVRVVEKPMEVKKVEKVPVETKDVKPVEPKGVTSLQDDDLR